MERPTGWLAYLDPDRKAGNETPWQPGLQLMDSLFTLDVWFTSADDCEEFVTTHVLGQRMYPYGDES
jgi:hypothetical protein